MLSKQHRSVLFLWPGAMVAAPCFREGGKHSFNSCPHQPVSNKAQESCVLALLLMLWMVSSSSKLHRVKPQDVKQIISQSRSGHLKDLSHLMMISSGGSVCRGEAQALFCDSGILRGSSELPWCSPFLSYKASDCTRQAVLLGRAGKHSTACGKRFQEKCKPVT